MNILPALKYRLRDMLKGAAVFALVISLLYIVTGVMVLTIKPDISGSASGYAVASIVFFLVLGICTPRENMRLCIQNGVSRRTAFLAELCASALTCAALALFGQLLQALAQLLKYDTTRFVVMDLYNILYAQENVALSFGQHMQSLVLNFALFFAISQFGAFISLGFFRLNKAWTIAVGVGVPLLVFMGLPLLLEIRAIYRIVVPALQSFFAWLGSGAWHLVLTAALFALLFALLNRLVGRRAPIRESRS